MLLLLLFMYYLLSPLRKIHTLLTPETNPVSGVRNVSAIPRLQFTVHHAIYQDKSLYFCIITFRTLLLLLLLTRLPIILCSFTF